MITKVAMLATGDEISEGDVLNTNTPQIAQLLVQANVPIGLQISCSDTEHEMILALSVLLQHHDLVITIGGLGPTSDDRTRFAISQVMAIPLTFSADSWQKINHHLITRPQEVHQLNRQQAFFPIGATIFPNQFGTADGCHIQKGTKHIFMLPGPPNECLPLFERYILPILQTKCAFSGMARKRWLLFGASEGEIAAQLDEALRPFDCITGYRWCYPYLEVKIRTPQINKLNEITEVIKPFIQPYQLSEDAELASTRLNKFLSSFDSTITIQDNATCGALQAKIVTPKTYQFLDFTSENTNPYYIKLSGLEEYWNSAAIPTNTELKIEFSNGKVKKEITEIITYRNQQLLDYVTEFVAHKIYEFLTHA